jgi:hypothetical protein
VQQCSDYSSPFLASGRLSGDAALVAWAKPCGTFESSAQFSGRRGEEGPCKGGAESGACRGIGFGDGAGVCSSWLGVRWPIRGGNGGAGGGVRAAVPALAAPSKGGGGGAVRWGAPGNGGGGGGPRRAVPGSGGGGGGPRRAVPGSGGGVRATAPGSGGAGGGQNWPSPLLLAAAAAYMAPA